MSRIERVLVTGGLGLLGRYVVSALSLNYAVTVATRTVPQESGVIKQADVRNLGRLQEIFEGQDAIVHLAGLDSVVEAAPRDFLDVNAFGTWCVFEAAAACGIKDIVYCSSASAYGLDHTNPAASIEKLPVDETHSLLAYRPYGLSKKFGETIAENFARRYGMRVCSLRVSAVVFRETIEELVAILQEVPETWQMVPAVLPDDASFGSNYSVPLYRSYVEAVDAARAFRCALENPAAGHRIFNICASDTLVPYRTLDFVAKIVGGRMPPYDATCYEAAPRAAVYSNDKARREIGWLPEKTWAEISKAYFQV